MDPEIAKLLNNTLPGALSVFTGALPLLGVITWFAFQQGDRFKRIDDRLDRLETKVDKLTDAITALIVEVRTLNLCVATLEAKDNQPRVFQG